MSASHQQHDSQLYQSLPLLPEKRLSQERLEAIGPRALHSIESIFKLTELSCNLQDRERKRIATELHDGLGQLITLLKLELGVAADMAKVSGMSKLHNSLIRAAGWARSASVELDRSIMGLYPAMLEDLGLTAALHWLVRETEAANAGLSIVGRINIREPSVRGDIALAIFRITQESMNNALKHAHANTLLISLDQEDEALTLHIEDNGIGFDSLAVPAGRAGLSSMVYRATLSGGTLNVGTKRGCGTTVTACWK